LHVRAIGVHDVDLRPHKADKESEAGIPRAKIDTLTAWWETELHSEAEQAALRYTEALTRAADTDRDAAFQRFHDRSLRISARRRSSRSSSSSST
jgi:alkylhydroperoxidase family enzyme